MRWAGSSHGAERRIFHGFADGDVERTRVLGGDGLQLDDTDLIPMAIPPIEVTYADGRTEIIEAP